MQNAIPMEAAAKITIPLFRRRSGRYTSRSRPTEKAGNNHSGQRGASTNPKPKLRSPRRFGRARQVVEANSYVRILTRFLDQPRKEEEGKVRAQHHRVPVREVPELQDAVDQCQSERSQRQDAADDDSDDEQLALVDGRPEEEPADEAPTGRPCPRSHAPRARSLASDREGWPESQLASPCLRRPGTVGRPRRSPGARVPRPPACSYPSPAHRHAGRR